MPTPGCGKCSAAAACARNTAARKASPNR
jgi:hypothetical protein